MDYVIITVMGVFETPEAAEKAGPQRLPPAAGLRDQAAEQRPWATPPKGASPMNATVERMRLTG